MSWVLEKSQISRSVLCLRGRWILFFMAKELNMWLESLYPLYNSEKVSQISQKPQPHPVQSNTLQLEETETEGREAKCSCAKSKPALFYQCWKIISCLKKVFALSICHPAAVSSCLCSELGWTLYCSNMTWYPVPEDTPPLSMSHYETPTLKICRKMWPTDSADWSRLLHNQHTHTHLCIITTHLFHIQALLHKRILLELPFTRQTKTFCLVKVVSRLFVSSCPHDGDSSEEVLATLWHE